MQLSIKCFRAVKWIGGDVRNSYGCDYRLKNFEVASVKLLMKNIVNTLYGELSKCFHSYIW